MFNGKIIYKWCTITGGLWENHRTKWGVSRCQPRWMTPGAQTEAARQELAQVKVQRQELRKQLRDQQEAGCGKGLGGCFFFSTPLKRV